MKLMTVLMLTALPLYCYAGSGCELLEKVIDLTLDRNVSVPEYLSMVKEFIPGEETKKAVIFFKEAFLHQSDETLEKFEEMQQQIYSSFWCARY
ncbi:mammaglobin-B-like [Artibeus jamaicensis]|uniref:mammaglobin-B-like n=1 Tax=Artibeus jamaicensis TaxID=9417 RepID=UPI00235B138A|nr:mammaglobin-B-like [Artibeus jamaicensis]